MITISQLSTSPHQNAGELLAGKFFPENPTFQNRKIGKSGKSFAKSDFIGIFFWEIEEFFIPIFQNQEILQFRISKTRIFFQEIGKFMEMQEMMEEILEMRKMRDMLKNVGELLGEKIFPEKSDFSKLGNRGNLSRNPILLEYFFGKSGNFSS